MTVEIKAQTDNGQPATVSLLKYNSGWDTVVGNTATDESGAATLPLEVCSGTGPGTFQPGKQYPLRVSYMQAQESGWNSWTENTRLWVKGYVTKPVVSLSAPTYTMKAGKCSEASVTTKASLLTREDWYLEVEAKYPGSSRWKIIETVSGRGSVNRTSKLYVCPGTGAGKYAVRSRLSVFEPSLTNSANATKSATLTVKDPVKSSKVTIKVKRVGKKVTVTGVVATGTKGDYSPTRSVKAALQRNQGGGWKTLKSISSKSGGKLKATVTAKGKAKYRWVVKGTSAFKAATSKTVKA